MRNMRSARLWATAVLYLFSFLTASAQSTGVINRPATSATGQNILNPNGDSYTSITASGFLGDDVTNSELPYRAVPSFSTEPFGDLRRGPSHLYSDFVPDAQNVGYYTYFNGSQLLFRFRMGSVMPGSKGYSVLLDTDGKFGATGASADPNYQPATSGTNGNPGFEIEIVLETNFRIAIYNVDGSSTPTLVKAYTAWQDLSQVSVAGTSDGGDPDFFIDFYIPFADLQAAPFSLTASTPLRMSATTVMAPQAAIGGPKSDLYGLNDAAYKSSSDQWEAYINAQPSFTANGLTTGGLGAMCTAAPTVNSPVSTGTVAISGTWTKSSLSGAAGVATIIVYKNGVEAGTIANVTSGTTWTLPNVTVANGDMITARAQAGGESLCLVSNTVQAQGCNTANIPSATGLSITCATDKGLEGAFVAGNQVTVYFISTSDFSTTTLAGPAANSPTFGYNGAAWFYNNTDYNGNNIPSACSGGAKDLANGIYYITTKTATGTCESAPVFACVGLAGTTATPVITQAALYPNSTVVSGTATAGAQVRLRINGQLVGTTTATGGAYSFSGLKLAVGDVVDVRALTTSNCISAAMSRTVTCFTTTPLLTLNNSGQLTAGQSITGTSGEPAGTTIKVYTAANAVVATVTVQSGGTWTTGAVTAATGTAYYATAQNGSCAESAASATAVAVAATTGRCGTITAPVSAGATTVSGTLASAVTGTKVFLYLDEVKVDSVTTSAATWTISTLAATTIYPNGVLTIGVQESGKGEQYCSTSATTIACTTGPATPVVSPSTSTLTAGQAQTYTVSNAVVGAFYGLADATTGQSLGSGVWATSGTVTLTTNAFTTGSYNVAIKGTSLSGVSVCSSPSAAATVVVSTTLPLTLLDFGGQWSEAGVLLNWRTEAESGTDHFEVERSTDGMSFRQLGTVTAYNTPSVHTYRFSDNSPATLNYYRLRMVDKDGRYTYSKVVSLRAGKTPSVSVHPNPFAASLTVQLASEKEREITVELTDVSGRVVRAQVFNATPGTNTLTLTGLEPLKPGTYLLQVKGQSYPTRYKLIKMGN